MKEKKIRIEDRELIRVYWKIKDENGIKKLCRQFSPVRQRCRIPDSPANIVSTPFHLILAGTIQHSTKPPISCPRSMQVNLTQQATRGGRK
jgi:hypothetical protein